MRGVDDHLARLAIVFTFVSHLVDIPPISDEPRDGVDVLLTLSGEASGPAVILSALLQALGENAPVRYAAGYAFVAAELSEGDLRRLPPFAAPIAKGGRLRVPLDPRSSRSPFAFLPRIAREALRVARQL